MSVALNTHQFQEKPNRFMPKTRVRVDKLVATQGKVNEKKVHAIAQKSPDEISATPVVSSRHKGYYHVLDGHHRVGAAIERGDKYITVKRVR